MTERHSRRRSVLAMVLPRAAAACAIATGVLVLIGWVIDEPLYKQIRPDWIPVAPTTAVCLILAGLSLILLHSPETAIRRRAAGRILALPVAAVGFIGVIESSFNVQILPKDWIVHFMVSNAVPVITHMAPNSALCLAFLGLTLIFLHRKSTRVICVEEITGIAALVVSGVAILGYMHGIRPAYTTGLYPQMSVIATLAFFSFSIGVLFSRTDRGLMSVFMNPYSGGRVARKILPVAMFLPFMLTMVYVLPSFIGRIPGGVRLTMVSASIVLVFSAVTLLTAHQLNKIDHANRDNAEALKRSERRFRAMFDQSPLGTLLYDANGTCIDANAAMETTWQLPRSFLLGRNLLAPHPMDGRGIVEEMRKAFSGETCKLSPYLLRPNEDLGIAGETRWQRAVAFPLRDDSGAVFQVAIMLEDITEQKRMEESTLRLGRILDNSWNEVYLTELGTRRFVQSNTTALQNCGYSDTELRQMTPLDLISETEQKRFEEALHAMNSGELLVFETVHRRKDGSEYPVEVRLQALKEESPPLGCAIVQDITQRKLAEAEAQNLYRELEDRVVERTTQLEQSNKALESFSYSVAHDLRAPLRGIDGFSVALEEEYGTRMDETGLHYLQRIRTATQRMAQMIDGLLNLSRVAREPIRRQAVDLSLIVRSIAEDLRHGEPERDVDFVVREGITAQADQALTRIALENLVRNAWKFTAKKSKASIEFGASVNGNGLPAYFIRDNGAGFDMAYSSKLFSVFQRLHSPKEFLGTGIGLATVQRIVHKHGGTCWAEGQVGTGATFYFTL
jgi:PAS domain S-box-containing protein